MTHPVKIDDLAKAQRSNKKRTLGSNELDKQQDGHNRQELATIQISCNVHKRDRVGMLASGDHQQ